MILLVCVDSYGNMENLQFETIAAAQHYIALSHSSFHNVSVYTSLTFEIETKVTICEDVTII